MLLESRKTVTRPTRSNETLQCLAGQLSQRAALFPVTVAISNKGGPIPANFLSTVLVFVFGSVLI
jgi:hypothetical protein